ncbi:hypothetical protein BUALT_Bualt02G0170400 [Buddleja alternifolia]|uniref:Gamma-tubulin complex component 6 n=1 Tax=Buddleja alternifolia TaxID=168488 RepID=A0AAV6Y1U9_9LAMI|nr:hypothetical protein BUALT_Bualt02G0170400 [Buddleja alternifolia]
MNALQGVESALMSIEKLSALLCYGSADRTSHRIPSVWSRCSSTSAVGNLLTSIGQFGCIIFLLRRFVNYFITPDFGGLGELEKNGKSDSFEEGKHPLRKHTLINQAFAISVRKVIDGYISALNTLSGSVSLRRFSKTNDGGCLTSIGHLEITLLEVYLHTTGLRTQIEALGNICNVNHLTVSFPVSSLEDMKTKENSEFGAFPRSGALLSFLYAQLKVADPDHCALLKFLFLQSYEPYSDFIRSWIYDGSISDPYHEFVVECANGLSIDASDDNGTTSRSPLPTIRVRDGVAVPCFLEECLVPLCRTGQQLQVIMKLLELCDNVGACDIHEEILPCLVGLSHEYHWFAFPLTFDKETIKRMVLVRASYYERMMEKIENILTKFDFSFRQATSQSVSSRIVNNLGENLNHQAFSVANENLIPPLTGTRNQNMHENKVNSELSSITDEYSYTEDLLDPSECTSSERSEEQNEAEQLNFASLSMEPSYWSALDFSLSLSTGNITQNLHQNEVSCSVVDVPFEINEKFSCFAHPSDKVTYLVGSEHELLRTPETRSTSSEHDLCLFDGQHIGRLNDNTWLHLPDCKVEPIMGSCGLLHTDLDLSENASKVNASIKDQHPHVMHTSTNTFSSQFWKLKYDSKFFSMNPTLNRGYFSNMRTMSGERLHANFKDSYFDFTYVKDPLKEYAVKFSGHYGPKLGTEIAVITEAPVVHIDSCNYLGMKGYNDIVIENTAESCNAGSHLHMKGNDDEHVLLPNVSGGSAWESMLSRSGNLVNSSTRDHRTRLVGGTEMPLDFVIKRCLVDEILLQYTYISKLTIKLLIEGFKLQEHLQALRCYHFMELADWADLFIMSLWSRKWLVNEVDKRIPEIQGVLELSVQRSSCEGDPNKDRLYAYLKGDCITHLSAPVKGIHSFDFLGLGYRVDWPVSIILTPAALKIYSEIFNFLIKVKLAVFSLSDAWCSLKYHLEQHKGEVQQVSVLTETRHKVSHFVSTLQQYVQSQLSQVSWYRFLHTLKHKVKDMLDMESVHMAYLTESLNICFLSNETRPIAGIIQNILQCAMDFRCCLTGSILRAGSSDEKLANRFSQLDISQVHSIRKAFSKNLEELYLIYLQSPKHGEFSVSRFWDYLNYNEYYAGVMNKQMGHSIFYS